MLLHDMLLFLDHVEIPEGFSRLKKDLLNRLDKEMSLGDNELRKLCNTFVYLFDSPKSDCQPSKPWQLLIDKVRVALKKYKPQEMIEDPFAFALLEVLAIEKNKFETKHVKIGDGYIKINERYLFPFRPLNRR